MADVSIELAKEYFEESGFLVKINRKYIPAGRTREKDAEIDIAVMNPKPEHGPLDFVISRTCIRRIPKAIIKVKGWHTENFSPSVLRAFPNIFQFLGKDSIKSAHEFFGSSEFKKILIVPSLPVAKETREKSIEILKDKGLDAVIEFKTILSALAGIVKINRNYFQSDTMQLVRLFKVYNMLKLGQEELFGRKRKML